MHRRNPPSAEDFRAFFLSRLRQLAPEEEIVWMSNVVPVQALRASYPLGVFPWPGNDPDLFPWVCPSERGILPVETFRLGHSTRRQLSRLQPVVTRDRAFAEVIDACHAVRMHESWIHPKMRAAYLRAHALGFAHSWEVWVDGCLAGGLYGIETPLFFAGESMFHLRPNAGKAAIAALVEYERSRGRAWIDIQQLTPHMQALGAEEWSRDRFLREIGLQRGGSLEGGD